MSVTFDIYGVQKVVANLAKAAAAANEGLHDGLLLGGHVIEGQAKINCPVGKSRPGYVGGTLRNSIDVQRKGDEVHVAPHTDYAAYVEFGTSRMAPRSYMRKALDTKRGEVERLIGHEVFASIEGVLPST